MPPPRRKPPRSPRHAALGEAVRRRREELELTQEELAEEKYWTRAKIGAIECGTGNPNLSTLLELGDALKADMADLFSSARAIHREGLPDDHRERPDSA